MIAEFLASTGLAGNGLAVCGARSVCSALGALEDTTQHIGHSRGDFRVERFVTCILRFEEHIAVLVLDARDDHRFMMDAVCRERAVGLGHLEGRDVFGAQRDDGVGRKLGIDAHAVRHLDCLIRTKALRQTVKARV